MLNATETVKDLQDMRDEGYLSDALLRHAVKAIAGSEDRFDWVGAFLTRDDESLWLHNYVGEPAQYAEIEAGSGANGIAAGGKANQMAANVDEWTDYEPCGPDVRSELVVLIRAGDDVFGSIDLGSEEEGAFSDDDETSVQAICDKLAEQIASERR